MPRRVVDLFACWRRLGGTPQTADVWKMVLSCPFAVSLEEINDRNFEDCERTVVELKSFFKILYHWTIALDFNLLSFHNFLELFSRSS
jgi:hypothetical protein